VVNRCLIGDFDGITQLFGATVANQVSARVYGALGPSTWCCSDPTAAHLHSNVASSLKPLLPDADRTKLAALFGHLTGIGLCRCPSARMVMRSSR
jgi:hypothetical protein